MIPQQTLESYPVFGDNATKVKPDDAKYAAGFQQADVLPAEWMNWAWAKNSKGITDANAGLSSIEEEIINVLTSRGKTPSASDNTQLLTVLNMIKAEAALAAHPVGSLYWTSSTENPATTFGGGTWTQIKDRFVLAAGDTYANGNTGGAATVTLTTDQIPSHNHSFTPSGTVSSHTHSVGAHSHGLNSHTHSVGAHSHTINSGNTSTAGTTTTAGFRGVSVTSGANNRGHTHSVGAHSHTINSGNTSSSGTATTAGIRHSGSTGAMSSNSTGNIRCFGSNGVKGNCSIENNAFTGVTATVNQSDSGSTSSIKVNVAHTHTLPASYIYGKTDNSTAFDSGAESQNHTHSVTASGYLYGKTDNSTAFNTGAASGSTADSTAFNSGSTQPTFTGTAGNTGSKGGGGAHNNMPPYIVKYCWERVS